MGYLRCYLLFLVDFKSYNNTHLNFRSPLEEFAKVDSHSTREVQLVGSIVDAQSSRSKCGLISTSDSTWQISGQLGVVNPHRCRHRPRHRCNHDVA